MDAVVYGGGYIERERESVKERGSGGRRERRGSGGRRRR